MIKQARAEAYYAQGLDELNAGNYQESLKKLLSALRLDRKNGRYLSALALNYFLLGKLDESVKYYREAIESDPDNFNNYIYLSNVLQIQEDFPSSTATLKKGLTLLEQRIAENPNEPFYYGFMGMLQYQLKNFDQSIMAYYRALTLRDGNGDYYRELANIYYELNFFEETIRLAEKAVSYNPLDYSAFLHLALAYQRLNLIGPAIAHLKRSLQINPNQPEVKELLKKLQEIRKENGETIEEVIRNNKPKKYYHGTVKWFDDSKGIGFLRTPELKKEVFVHYTAVISEGYQTLSEGEAVRFGVAKSKRGPVALEVTITNPDMSRFHFGSVKDFDWNIGIGLIRGDGEAEYNFHFTAIVGRLIKTARPGEKVRFELIRDENTQKDTAYNIVILKESTDENRGTVVWFDHRTGNGMIKSDDGMELIFQSGSFPDTLADKLGEGVKITFKLTQVENIDGNMVPKAVSIALA
ncbi:MAG: cold shock domain-containing protein [Candidatus Wallbacteria bacterium]|nr:cold shock domain-containing protein [Candidatus Wallbacteria bacterium]